MQGFVHANGRKTKLGPADILKFCPNCTAILLELFVPKKATRKSHMTRDETEKIRNAIVAFIKKPTTSREVMERFEMTGSQATYHLTTLFKAKKLKRLGKGSQTKYVQP